MGDGPTRETGKGLIRANPTPWFRRFFAGYSAWMMRRSFASVRMTADSAPAVELSRSHDGPLIAAMNHASWWDPLVAVVVSQLLMASDGAERGRRAKHGRTLLTPMDRVQLQTFGFMRRLGVFGIDPDDSASLEVMTEYVVEEMARHDRPVLGITPQGSFTDVRAPVRIRPGTAAVTAAAEARFGRDRVKAVVGAAEFTFWSDKRPELLFRLIEVGRPEGEGTVAAWHRAISRAMRTNQEVLTAASVARDDSLFVPMLGGGGAKPAGDGRIHPVYDAVLRARGRTGRIAAKRGGAG